MKRAEYLIDSSEDRENSALLLQFETEMWAISLSQVDQSDLNQNVFGPLDDTLLPRYMIRSHVNHDHVFCATSLGNTHKVVKVQLNFNSPGKVETKDIHILIAGMVAGLECDPENPNCIYLIDDN